MSELGKQSNSIGSQPRCLVPVCKPRERKYLRYFWTITLVLHSIFISSSILLMTFYKKFIWNNETSFPAQLWTGRTGIGNLSNPSFICRSLTMTVLRKHPDYDVGAETRNETSVLHTVTRWQRMAPEVVFLTNQWILVAQSVSSVTLEWHRGPDGQVCVRPCSVDRDTRIHAGVCVQCDHCKNVQENIFFVLYNHRNENLIYFTILM